METSKTHTEFTLIQGTDSHNSPITIDLEDLRPNYPNERKTGISNAHNIAIRTIFKFDEREEDHSY